LKENRTDICRQGRASARGGCTQQWRSASNTAVSVSGFWAAGASVWPGAGSYAG